MIRLTLERTPKEDIIPLEGKLADIIGLPIGGFDYEIRKKSLDARKNRVKFVYTIDLFVQRNEEKIARKCGGSIMKAEEEYSFPASVFMPENRPVVAGFGPAGIFVALMLARNGLKPIVIERGKEGIERKKDVDTFFCGGKLDPESNIQYGEGGAGAFSDGKLNTLIKDKSFRGRLVLKELVRSGAPKEILYISKPHVGTDLLRDVVKNLREEIISLGGEILFQTKLLDIKTDKNGNLEGVVTANGEIKTDTLFLATGQSAREIAEMLYKHGAELERKPFSVGFRVEHPQSVINASQYGEGDHLRFLPPAEYKLFKHCNTGRTVYSFCMCPGGVVVAAASEQERLVTNGMSYHSRDGRNANSAILCEILDSDIGEGLFAGYDYREKLERFAFEIGGNDFTAPAMTLGEYLGNKKGSEPIETTYPRGVKYCDISKLFSKEINDSFREAFADFGRKIKGFDDENAVITAVESRTSSPIRIKRFDDRQSNIKGIYPLGEGAGYAGGIISAAIDGVRSAEEYVLSLNNYNKK
ncbi:MAG: hypothetical protein IKC39_01735 [Clostridia bacterium]|nr:hypothetical protein [Clostridia bacterium]